MISPNYSAVAKSWVVGTEHFGKDIAITAETDVRLNILQTTSIIRFLEVTQIVCRSCDQSTATGASSTQVDLSTWSGRGEMENLSFADGVARLILVTSGPGDRWATEWSIACNAVQVKTHILPGKTLRAFTHWMICQWVFWLLLLMGIPWLLHRLFHIF